MRFLIKAGELSEEREREREREAKFMRCYRITVTLQEFSFSREK
jgi:hypothetical protein